MTVLSTFYQALREAALAASPGPWRRNPETGSLTCWRTYPDRIPRRHREYLGAMRRDADARYVALAEPVVVLSLLDEREAVRTRLSALLPAQVLPAASGTGLAHQVEDLIASLRRQVDYNAQVAVQLADQANAVEIERDLLRVERDRLREEHDLWQPWLNESPVEEDEDTRP